MRIVNYLRRDRYEPGARKPTETSADRAAHNTNWATDEPGATKPAATPSERAALKTDWAALAIVILAAVIAGVGIAQWTILRSQLDEMKSANRQSGELIKANSRLAEAAMKQANAFADTARVSQYASAANQRAWIGPRNARISAEPQLSEPITIILEYQNTGREPATNFTYEVESFTATREEESKSGLRRTTSFMNKCMSASQLSHGQVIYPTTGSSFYILSTRLDGKMVDEKVVSGNKTIYFQGCLSYQTLMTVHHSFFCYYYKKGDTKSGRMGICNAGHNAD